MPDDDKPREPQPTVELLDPTAGAEQWAHTVEGVRTVFHRALRPALRDDRFDDWAPPADLVAALARVDGVPAAFLGGGVHRGRLQLDALAVDDIDEHPPESLVDGLFEHLGDGIAASGAEIVELWGRPALPWHGGLADRRGMTELRALHQMRCSLPVGDELAGRPLPDRPFRPGVDEKALLRVNNRAFASHPDQGGMTLDDLTDAATQPWFDPDAIRLYDDPAGGGHAAGFCWTKIHEPLAEGEPWLGEIYAIGIDPDHHGKGLGRPMTAAGLRWLTSQGLTTGMLYVEADNEPAVRTYRGLGFTEHRTDRAWSMTKDGPTR